MLNVGQVQDVVAAAKRAGRKVRVAGARHSTKEAVFSPAPRDYRIVLGDEPQKVRLLRTDESGADVSVGGGCYLGVNPSDPLSTKAGSLNYILEEHGYAFARLEQLKLYPTDRVELGSETDTALRARADDEAAGGDLTRAAETYRTLLAAIMAAKPQPETSLSDATDLASLYQAMAALHRRVGRQDDASALDARRAKLWRHWNQQLPDNPFVTARLTEG